MAWGLSHQRLSQSVIIRQMTCNFPAVNSSAAVVQPSHRAVGALLLHQHGRPDVWLQSGALTK